EAVYALQDMQPGMEKVYFTLQEELLKPQAQAVFKPGETIDTLVREPVLADARQQVAEALLTAVRPKVPPRWDINPAFERRQKLKAQVAQVGWALFQHATQNKPFMVQDPRTRSWGFKPGLLDTLVRERLVDKSVLTDSVGGTLTLEGLAKLEKGFT